jgi:hypothetical protein
MVKRPMTALCVMVGFIALTLFILNIPADYAANQNDDAIEIVVLFDVSGSMNYADPPPNWPLSHAGVRVSTEAVRLFASLRPTFADTHISFVAFCYFVEPLVESVNIRTEGGMVQFRAAIDALTSDIWDDTANQFAANRRNERFRPWQYTTNIGGALREAYEILERSTAAKKVVLLFTDGKIDMGAGVALEPYIQLANTYRDRFASADIPVYTIGLNADGTVDIDFLNDLSERTGALPAFVTPSGATMGNHPTLGTMLVDFFRNVFADIMDAPPPPPSEPWGTIGPTGLILNTVNIYGTAVKEVNITLSSSAAFSVQQVLTPNGINIIDSRDRVMIDTSAMITNVKIIEPDLDGEWTIEIAGQPGTIVSASEISLFDLSLRTSVPNNVTVDFGETLDFRAFLYNNDRNIVVTTRQVYIDSISRTHATVHDGRGILVDEAVGVLTPASDGFGFAFAFDRPGTYEITAHMTNNQIRAVSEPITVTVRGPSLAVRLGGAQVGQNERVSGTVGLFGSTGDGNPVPVPPQLAGTTGRVTITNHNDLQPDRPGAVVETIEFAVGQLDMGMFEFSFIAELGGRYTVEAVLVDAAGNVSLRGESAEVGVVREALINTFPSSVSFTVSGGRNVLTYDLTEYFKVASGSPLSFRVEAGEGANNLKHGLEGNVLELTVERGTAVFHIYVYNNGELIHRHEVTLSVRYMADTIRVFAIIAAVILAIALIFFGLRYKTMVIRKPFGLTLVFEKDFYVEWEYEEREIRISGSRLQGRASMKLTEVLNADTLYHGGYHDIPDAIRGYASRIILQGRPFGGQGFRVVDTNRGGKKYLFTGGAVNIRFAGGEDGQQCTITFKSSF